MSSVRVNFIVEGQTEEIFIRDVLKELLASRCIYVNARRVETSRKKINGTNYSNGKQLKIYRGGIPKFEKVKRDIDRWLKEDSKAYLTTMFDFYALPRDFPKFEQAMHAKNPFDKVKILEDGFRTEINDPHFIPYIQLHEFEGLLFSNVEIIDEILKPYHQGSQLNSLKEIRKEFNTPEEINDGVETAPSKRLINLYKSYDKAVYGSRIAKRIGIDDMRCECKHFNEWLVNLISLVIYR